MAKARQILEKVGISRLKYIVAALCVCVCVRKQGDPQEKKGALDALIRL